VTTPAVPATVRAAEPTDAWDITAVDRRADLGALPVWAGDLVDALCDTEEAVRQEWTLHTAQRHERVLARSTSTGHVWIANRGRGLTSLDPAEAHALALFLLGPENIRSEGTEWGTTPEEVTGDYVPGVRTYGTGDNAEDRAYSYAERVSTPTHVMHRPRYTLVGPWEIV
jgi:hypothetical protein